MSKRKRGPSKLDVLAIACVLVLAAVFLLPKLQGVRMAHNESSALQALTFLRERMIELKDRRSGPPPEAQLTPRDLTVDANGKSLLDDAHFESHARFGTVMRRHGYFFATRYLANQSIGPRSGYVLFAWPVQGEAYGRTSFAALPDGSVYQTQHVLDEEKLLSNESLEVGKTADGSARPLGIPPGFEKLD